VVSEEAVMASLRDTDLGMQMKRGKHERRQSG
jgi:hypothetical protein